MSIAGPLTPLRMRWFTGSAALPFPKALITEFQKNVQEEKTPGDAPHDRILEQYRPRGGPWCRCR